MLAAYAILAAECFKHASNTVHLTEARALGELAMWASHLDAAPAFSPDTALGQIQTAYKKYADARKVWLTSGNGQTAMDAAGDALNTVMGQQRAALADALRKMPT
jgi:hypothetical protein